MFQIRIPVLLMICCFSTEMLKSGKINEQANKKHKFFALQIFPARQYHAHFICNSPNCREVKKMRKY